VHPNFQAAVIVEQEKTVTCSLISESIFWPFFGMGTIIYPLDKLLGKECRQSMAKVNDSVFMVSVMPVYCPLYQPALAWRLSPHVPLLLHPRNHPKSQEWQEEEKEKQ